MGLMTTTVGEWKSVKTPPANSEDTLYALTVKGPYGSLIPPETGHEDVPRAFRYFHNEWEAYAHGKWEPASFNGWEITYYVRLRRLYPKD